MLQNPYIASLIIAFLMFLDYFLTLKGFRLYRATYSKYIKVQSYELNPLFKEKINQQKYSLRHLLSVILTAFATFVFYYLGKNNILIFKEWIFIFWQGMIFSMLAYINTKHFQNIMMMNSLKKYPNMLSGKLVQKHLFSLENAYANVFAVFLVLIVAFIFQPSFFMLGFIVGPLLLIFKNRAWTKKYLKEKKKH